jgi:hypothetical protein
VDGGGTAKAGVDPLPASPLHRGQEGGMVEINATRQRGYAISQAEFSFGVMTLAAPIFDGFGNVQMSCSVPV